MYKLPEYHSVRVKGKRQVAGMPEHIISDQVIEVGGKEIGT